VVKPFERERGIQLKNEGKNSLTAFHELTSEYFEPHSKVLNKL